ncbi:MAG: tetratricopeptide repeat protein [Gemmatimonadaceae bacterium]
MIVRFTAACGLSLALLGAVSLAAQDVRPTVRSESDVAISDGRLADAESILFSASSAAPRDPSARGALGMFLASRGRLKVGAVLLEEARQFGGDAAVVDARLARIYGWLGDWAGFAALKHYATAGPEHERALWLLTHPTAQSGPDTVTVPLEPNEMAGLGRVVVSIGGASITADIDPAVDGLVLPSSPDVTAESKQFGMHDSATVAVVYAAGIGELRFTNIPARLSPTARPTVGLDVLAAFMPTFDAAQQVLTLHQHPLPPDGALLPFVLGFPGVSFAARAGEPLARMESAAGRAALRGSRWSFDLRRGAIVVLP